MTSMMQRILQLSILLIMITSAIPQMLLVNEYNNTRASFIEPHVSRSPCVPIIVAAPRSHKILLFLDSAFMELFQNWLYFYSNVCSDYSPARQQLLVVCIDGDAHHGIQQLNLTCHPEYSDMVQKATQQAILSAPSANDTNTGVRRKLVKKKSVMRHVIWMKRLEIVSMLLQRGEDVLLSDLDAIWLRNPYPDITSHLQSGSSVISSRATYPEEISRVWGRSLCMGFVYLKADSFTNHLLSLVLADMQRTFAMFSLYEKFLRVGNLVITDSSTNLTVVFDRAVFSSVSKKPPDDQHSFNVVLRNLNVTWEGDMQKHLNASRSYRGRIVGGDGLVSYVAMLPEQSFLRNCVDSDRFPPSMRPFKHYPTIELRDRIRNKVRGATVAHCLISTTEAKNKESHLVYYSLFALPYNAQDVSTVLLSDASRGVTLRQPGDIAGSEGVVMSSEDVHRYSPASLNNFIVNATQLREYLEKRKKRTQRIRDLLRNSSSSSWNHAFHRNIARSSSGSSRRQVLSYTTGRSQQHATAAPTPASATLETVKTTEPQSGDVKLFLRGSRQRYSEGAASF